MYFHVHIVSILAAIALHQKHKPRETCASSKAFPSSSSCQEQCQPVHSNNNDKVDWTPPPHLTLPFNFQALSVHGILSKTSEYP